MRPYIYKSATGIEIAGKHISSITFYRLEICYFLSTAIVKDNEVRNRIYSAITQEHI